MALPVACRSGVPTAMLVGTMLSQVMQLYACHSCCTSDSLIADMSVSTCTDTQGTDKCVLLCTVPPALASIGLLIFPLQA